VLWFIVVLIYNPQGRKFCSFNIKGVRRGGGGASGVGVNPAIRIRVWLPGLENSS